MSATLGHILRRAARSLWENLSLNAVAAGVIAAALLLGGAFWGAMSTLNDAVEVWERDVHLSAYFASGVDEARQRAVLAEVQAMPEVEAVTWVTATDARAYLEERVPDIQPILVELGEEAVPASLEITLRARYIGDETLSDFVTRLQRAEFEELDYGKEWVERLTAFLGLLKALGAALGTLLVMAAVFLVGNTMHLVTYARRAELETMKLVGATLQFIAAPFLIEGAVQGLIGALLAIGALSGLKAVLLGRIQELLPLGQAPLADGSLGLSTVLGLLTVGVLLGVVGCGSAVLRFWRQAP